MAPSKNAEREAREARERLRRYTARQGVHSHQVNRRRRDNIIALVLILVVGTAATIAQVLYFAGGPGKSAPSASASGSATPTPSQTAADSAEKNTGEVPNVSISEERLWKGELSLNAVKLGISIDGTLAPQSAAVFIDLVKKNFYTGSGKTCHRLTKSSGLSVIQCGSTSGDGRGDAGFTYGPVENAPKNGVYPAGTIAMARSTSQYSQSTQFFITYASSTLPTDGGGYTVFGHVTSGLDSFISEIASKGVAATSNSPDDGPPADTTTITAVTVN